jgi:diguanylate cyclase (GGDEF)-like protein
MKIDSYQFLKTLLLNTAPLTGAAFFDTANALLCTLLKADFSFITCRRFDSPHTVDVLASHRDNQNLGRWSFELEGTPCSMIYAEETTMDWAGFHVGGAVSVARDVCRRFDSTHDTQYQAFVGTPLRDVEQNMIGHMALFFEKPLSDNVNRAQIVELAGLFAIKVQAELNRTLAEQAREQTVRELETVNLRLLNETITDHLTQLYNRRYFSQRMQEAFGRLKRNEAHYALLILDVDHFKTINDRYGHDAGDVALRHVARVLGRNCRANVELLFRIGGEEFAILSQGQQNTLSLQQFGERINHAFRRTPVEGIEDLTVTVSAGGAFPEPSDPSWAALFKRADAAMYRAKKSGRDCTIIDPIKN